MRPQVSGESVDDRGGYALISSSRRGLGILFVATPAWAGSDCAGDPHDRRCRLEVDIGPAERNDLAEPQSATERERHHRSPLRPDGRRDHQQVVFVDHFRTGTGAGAEGACTVDLEGVHGSRKHAVCGRRRSHDGRAEGVALARRLRLVVGESVLVPAEDHRRGDFVKGEGSEGRKQVLVEPDSVAAPGGLLQGAVLGSARPEPGSGELSEGDDSLALSSYPFGQGVFVEGGPRCSFGIETPLFVADPVPGGFLAVRGRFEGVGRCDGLAAASAGVPERDREARLPAPRAHPAHLPEPAAR